MAGTIAIFSSRLWSLRREVEWLTGYTPVRARLGLPAGSEAVAGWGDEPRARRAAVSAGLPYALIGDGFLRSIRPGPTEPSFSYTVDWTGDPADASGPSDLERLILEAAREEPSPDVLATLQAARLSQVNPGRKPTAADGLPERFVLIVDEPARGAPTGGAFEPNATFQAMLDAAIRHFGGTRTVVVSGAEAAASGRGTLGRAARQSGALVLEAPIDPWALFPRCEAVYTVSSLTGLEALIAGVPVRCFGTPFYAGWGLTTDEAEIPRRSAARPSLAALVDAAYGRYCRSADPFFGGPSTLQQVVATLGDLKTRFQSGPRIVTGGLSRWKRAAVTPYLDRADGPPIHCRTLAEALATARSGAGQLAVWGASEAEDLPADVVRIEDGFLRSVGLGVQGAYPASLVLDPHGIYYDPSRPSGFEALVAEARFDDALLARASALRTAILAARLSKYNVGLSQALPTAGGRLKILVPGQVESDASIRLGAAEVRTNADLLVAVRRRHPNAFILYKPHPDVVTGLRRGAVPDAVLDATADQVVLDAAITDCLDWADRVETITSLTGFEALLREKAVAVHGRPFYAGWGLTEDLTPMPDRRQRTLALDALVAAALILYPAYVDPATRRPCPVEVVVRRLAEPLPKETSARRLGRLTRSVHARLANRIGLIFSRT